MTLTLRSKSLEPTDYVDLQPAMRHLNYTVSWARGKEYLVGLAHPHRLWEYASAITAMTQHFGEVLTGKTVLDVGSGPSALGPTLAVRYGCTVTEADPSVNVAPLRAPMVEAFQHLRYGFLPIPLAEITGTFDAVFCISVLEHLPADQQEAAWRKLAGLVKPGGLLVATIDFGKPDQKWTHDTDREVKLGAEDVDRIVGWLQDSGIAVTQLDTAYHGPQVYDYTFFRLVGSRPAV